MYSNALSNELLPSMIKPLEWSIAIHLTIGAWTRLLSEVTGAIGPRPEQIARQFYYRAYLRTDILRRMLEPLGLPMGHLKRLLGEAPADLENPRSLSMTELLLSSHSMKAYLVQFCAHDDHQEEFLEKKLAELKGLAEEDLEQLTEDELSSRVGSLTNALEDVSYFKTISALALLMFKNDPDPCLGPAGKEGSSFVPGKRGPILAAPSREKRVLLLSEQSAATYSFGYAIFHRYFEEAGRRFAGKELLASANDAYYLNINEVRQFLAGGCSGNTCNNYRLRAALRKREMSELEGLVLPGSIIGESAPPLIRRD